MINKHLSGSRHIVYPARKRIKTGSTNCTEASDLLQFSHSDDQDVSSNTKIDVFSPNVFKKIPSIKSWSYAEGFKCPICLKFCRGQFCMLDCQH